MPGRAYHNFRHIFVDPSQDHTSFSSKVSVSSIRVVNVNELPTKLLMGSMAAALFPGAPLSKANSTSSLRATNLSIQHVALGDVLFKTWYPSYYPEGLVGRELDRLYVCQWCFKYCPDLVPYLAHRVTSRRATLTAATLMMFARSFAMLGAKVRQVN